jgi:DNA-binding CsgD family transcriptional regulator
MTDESQISEREREILKLVATGATNQQIAQQLSISINTVKVHLRNIFSKLGVVSRTEATLYAVRMGLVDVERGGAPTAVADGDPEYDPEADADDPPVGAVTTAPPPIERPLGPELDSPPVSMAAIEPEALLLEPAEHREPLQTSVTAAPTPETHVNRMLLIGLAAALVLIAGLVAALLARNNIPATPNGAPTVSDPAGVPALNARWRDLPALASGRSDFALSGVTTGSGSALYVIGGVSGAEPTAEVWRFDFASEQWAPAAPKALPVADVQAATIGQRIYVPGGRTVGGAISDLLEMYDPQTDTWTTLTPLPEARSRYSLATLDGKLYLFGGWDGTNYSDMVWRYSPDDDAWERMNNMPVLTADAGAAVVDGLVYLLGGENASGLLNQSLRYNPADEGRTPWTSLAPLPSARARAGVTAMGDLVFVMGGSLTDAEMLYFSAANGMWEALAPPFPALVGLRAQTLAGKIFVVGGRSAEQLESAVYEYSAIYTLVVPLN